MLLIELMRPLRKQATGKGLPYQPQTVPIEKIVTTQLVVASASFVGLMIEAGVDCAYYMILES